MSFKDVDFLSQEISLFYYGRTRHSGNLGGILTILMILSCFLYIFYAIYEVFLHTTSTIQYYRHYFKNPGNYTFNNSQGIFHYFQISNITTHQILPINSKYLRMFMTNIHEEYKSNYKLLEKNEHWVYDNCREGIDNKNLSKDLFKDVSFKNALCLRYYYNNNNQKYYPIEDTENFKYPELKTQGENVEEYTIGTIIEKCYNDSILTTLFGPCTDNTNIDNYFKNQSNYGVNFNVLTNEIRPGIYEETIYKFIYEISNPMRKKHLLQNNIIFNPLILNFNLGLFLPNKTEKQIFSFSESLPEAIDKKENDNILCVYIYNLVNHGYIYKATYQTIYDSLYKIGGIFQLIYYVFFGINYLFNRFTIINDTKKLIFTLHNDEKVNGGKEIKKFTNIVKNVRYGQINNINSIDIIKASSYSDKKGMITDPKNMKHRLTNNFQESSFFQKSINNKSLDVFPFMSDKSINFYSNKKNFINDSDSINEKHEDNNDKNEGKKIIIKSLEFQNENGKQNKKSENLQRESILNKSNRKEKSDFINILNVSQNIKNKNNNHYNFPSHEIVDKDILDFKALLKKYFDYKKKFFVYEKMKAEKFTQFLNLRNYMASLFCYKKAKNYILTLANFRKKLLSEEHFFRAQNYLYLFEKTFELKESRKIDIIELFKNL